MTQVFGCVRNTIKLCSGKYFDLADPKPEQIDIRDIAGALSKICRFGGHCRKFYSVAEHLINCKLQAEQDGLTPQEIAAVFLHDATEAYVGDMVKPLKIMLPEYQAVEARVQGAIGQRFGVDFEKHAAAVEKIDREMLIAERQELFGTDGVVWYGQNDVRRLLNIPFRFMSPGIAELGFIQHAADLGLLCK